MFDFRNFFFCCNNIIENDNLSIQCSNKNKNNFLNEKDRDVLFNKEELVKKKKSRNSNLNNINNNYNLNSVDKNSSIITFSNIKVKEGKSNINQFFDTEVLSTQELKLIGEIFWNKDLYIDKIGLKIGNRIKKNGNTIFGLGEQEDLNGNIIIDFILNLPGGKIESMVPLSKNNPLFSIDYDKNEEFFEMILINKQLKIFYNIENEFYLKNDSILEFMIGKIPIIIKGPKNENDNYFSIQVEGDIYNYDKTKDVPISIGRSNSNINIKNNSISKKHAIIDNLNDCLYIKDLNSTNGTFFVINEKWPSIKISRDMNFKICDCKFSIKVIE
jgi:hypothetical protein